MAAHKWAEVIKAWSEGAVIEYRSKLGNSYGSWVEDVDPSWGEPFEFRVKPAPHKHAALIKAHQDGAKIQWQHTLFDRNWQDIEHPSWGVSIDYRIKPEEPKVHPHQWCIDAFKLGAQIQTRNSPSHVWVDVQHPKFMEIYEYRVKPYADTAQYVHVRNDSVVGATYNPKPATPNVRLTFNGFTGALKGAEFIGSNYPTSHSINEAYGLQES